MEVFKLLFRIYLLENALKTINSLKALSVKRLSSLIPQLSFCCCFESTLNLDIAALEHIHVLLLFCIQCAHGFCCFKYSIYLG